MMDRFEKWQRELRRLFYESKGFTTFAIALIVLLVIAFPNVMLWVAVTSLVFIFVKGVILIVEMINNR